MSSDLNPFDESTFPSYLTDKRMSPEGRKSAPKNLRALHHEILRLTILGWKGTAIALHLGITPVTVSNCLSSTKGRAVMLMLNAARSERSIDIGEDMRQFAPIAFNVVKDITSDDKVSPAVRLRGADLALGLAGYVKPQRIQSSHIVTHLTAEEIEDMKTKARARAHASGVIAQLPEETGIVIDLELESDENEPRSMVSVGAPSNGDGETEKKEAEIANSESADGISGRSIV